MSQHDHGLRKPEHTLCLFRNLNGWADNKNKLKHIVKKNMRCFSLCSVWKAFRIGIYVYVATTRTQYTKQFADETFIVCSEFRIWKIKSFFFIKRFKFQSIYIFRLCKDVFHTNSCIRLGNFRMWWWHKSLLLNPIFIML